MVHPPVFQIKFDFTGAYAFSFINDMFFYCDFSSYLTIPGLLPVIQPPVCSTGFIQGVVISLPADSPPVQNNDMSSLSGCVHIMGDDDAGPALPLVPDMVLDL